MSDPFCYPCAKKIENRKPHDRQHRENRGRIRMPYPHAMTKRKTAKPTPSLHHFDFGAWTPSLPLISKHFKASQTKKVTAHVRPLIAAGLTGTNRDQTGLHFLTQPPPAHRRRILEVPLTCASQMRRSSPACNASVTAGRARQSSARRSAACGGAQRTDAPYPLPLTRYLCVTLFLANLVRIWVIPDNPKLR